MKKTFVKSLIAVTAVAAMLPAFTLGAAKQTDRKPLDPAALADRTQQYGQILSVLQNLYVDSLDMETVIRTGIDAMLESIDPYTEFYDRTNLDQLTSLASGNYGGIGSGIMAQDSVAVLSDPYYGKPAALAGVRHGDIILQIDDYVVPKNNIELSDISNRLKGNPGTHVRVKVRRPWLPPGEDTIFVFDIERAKVSIDPVPVTTVFDDGVAYIDVSTFNKNTADEIRDAFAAIKSKHGKNLKGVIIDLRDNGGGLLESAVSLLSIFIDQGSKVVETRYRDGSSQVYKTRKKPLDASIPLAVLVNGNTASASEIVSGAIQDLDRGVIIGRRTFGKGLVQTSSPLSSGNVLKYTTGKYYLPSGRLVQALDYRDSDGKPTLIPDSLTHEFRTAAGRVVRDGRGIAPDVDLDPVPTAELTWQLYNNRWIDNFANRYRNTHPEAPALTDSIVTDRLFDEFKNFVDSTQLKYGRASRAGIEYLRDATRVEGLANDSVMAAIDALEAMLSHDLAHEIDANRADIVELLEIAILQRYYPENEITLRSIVDDEHIVEARRLLLDPERYKSLLRPKK